MSFRPAVSPSSPCPSSLRLPLFAAYQISDSVKPYTNVKPAAAIDWAAMDAKIQTPGVVAAYKAAVESIKVEPIDPSPILKSLHAKYDKLVRKPCRWAVGGGIRYL